MKLNMTCSITLPSGSSVEMTAVQLLNFHDDLTKFINDNYDVLNKEDNV